jgi:hypothetical protein
MNTIVIQSDKKINKLIAKVAKELGGRVYDVSNDIMEDIALGNMMNCVKTNELVSRDFILDKINKK